MQSNMNWHRPVLVFYRQRSKKGERKAFAVVKARDLVLIESENGIPRFSGKIADFFPLMGELDYLLSEQGLADEFVVCWFADEHADFKKDFRRLNGVKFKAKLALAPEELGKKTYNADITAKGAKLK